MEFVATSDQTDLQGELRRLLVGRFGPDRRRAAIDLPGAVDRDRSGPALQRGDGGGQLFRGVDELGHALSGLS